MTSMLISGRRRVREALDYPPDDLDHLVGDYGMGARPLRPQL
jgi:hypothetical protein